MSIPRVKRSSEPNNDFGRWKYFGRLTRGDKVAAAPISEFVEDTISVLLAHAGVDVKTGVAKLGDFLGEEFDPADGVAKYDRLVDLELGGGGCERGWGKRWKTLVKRALRQWTFCLSST